MKVILTFIMCLCIGISLPAQERKIPFNGVLKDFAEKPIRKARIYIDNPRSYASTTKIGNFGLTDVDYADTLNIVIKKRTYKVPIEHKRSIVILLDLETGKYATREDFELLDKRFDHVNHRERTLGAIVTGEKIRQSNTNNLLEALSGKVPGLNISKNEQGGVGKINMRGINSFNSDTTPLFVLDGTVVDNVDAIPLHDIDYVEVLRDGSYYGSRGANGAILIFTKIY